MLTITGDLITSDLTDVSAIRPGITGWFVDGYPARTFDRNQAITAVTIADERAKPNPNLPLIATLESELRSC